MTTELSIPRKEIHLSKIKNKDGPWVKGPPEIPSESDARRIEVSCGALVYWDIIIGILHDLVCGGGEHQISGKGGGP